MQALFEHDTIAYTGEQLANHWIYQRWGILGDAMVGFVGPCQVSLDNMVDLEDVRNADIIASSSMLNFIIEVFGASLREGVLLQRLLITILKDRILEICPDAPLTRRGDDLFLNDSHKLSVSICAPSPTSVLIHAGLNVDAKGAPVVAAGLASDLGIQGISDLAEHVMKTLIDEWHDIQRSCWKVRSVGNS